MSHCDTHVKNAEWLDERSTFYERVMCFLKVDEGESREAFATRLEVPIETLNRWAQGALPTQPWRYIALAEKLGCSAAWLYAGRNGEKPGKVERAEKAEEVGE